jgi:hypothetical protein
VVEAVGALKRWGNNHRRRLAGRWGSDGLRALVIAYREHRLPKSTPPPPWSAPRGWPDELLDELKSGNAVEVSSSMLLSAMIAAGLDCRRYAYGGADWGKVFELDEHDRLTELVDE